MGLIGRLLERLSGSGSSSSQQPTFRCLNCGAGQDRDYHTCPDCGGTFVVPDTGEEPAPADDPPWR